MQQLDLITETEKPIWYPLRRGKRTKEAVQQYYLPKMVKVLVKRRYELGMSQEELEHRLGTCKGHVDKWERGVITPTIFNYQCWAETLGMELKFEAVDAS